MIEIILNSTKTNKIVEDNVAIEIYSYKKCILRYYKKSHSIYLDNFYYSNTTNKHFINGINYIENEMNINIEKDFLYNLYFSRIYYDTIKYKGLYVFYDHDIISIYE